MQINIKRIDSTLPLPVYHTPGAVAFDFYSRIDETILPGETRVLPTNFIIATPVGYMLMITARSSLARKKGLMMGNGVGTIDQDFCGDNDELQLLVYNFTKTPVTVVRGERLAQGIFVKIDKAEWVEVPSMTKPSRGGFGTTGTM